MSSARPSAIWDLRLRQFLLPKLGHDAAECEDVIGIDEQNYRFAIADGATEAFDARNWAQRLAGNWVRSESAVTPEAFHEWVAAEAVELHCSWSEHILPWYAEEKAATGSFAAFIGVELELGADVPSWKAIALGDACLLHCRDGVLLKSLPVSHSDDFNSAPLLVASDPGLYESSAQSIAIESGSCKDNDILFLLSDAIAAWYLERFEQNDFSDPFDGKDNAQLIQFFETERLAGRIRNDDLAILRLEIQHRSVS